MKKNQKKCLKKRFEGESMRKIKHGSFRLRTKNGAHTLNGQKTGKPEGSQMLPPLKSMVG